MLAARIRDLRGPTARRNPERMQRLPRLWRPARPWARPLARRRGSQLLPRVSLPEGNCATASPFAFLLFRAFRWTLSRKATPAFSVVSALVAEIANRILGNRQRYEHTP